MIHPHPTQAWRDAIAEELPDASGREMAVWKDPAVIIEILARLSNSGRCFIFGGTSRDPEHVRRFGSLTSVTVQRAAKGSEEASSEAGEWYVALQVGDVALNLRQDSLFLNFIPHAADTADAGFLLSGTAADEETHAWDVPSRGNTGLQLVLGEEHGLLIGAARSIFIRHPMYASQLTRSLAGGIYRPGDTERLAYEGQIKKLVKDEYAKRKGAHRSGAMDQTDVDSVSWDLLQYGLQPTIELLREVHGSGSPSALHPKLKVFFGKLVKEYIQPLPPPSVPEPVRLIWDQLVATSRETAAAALQTEVDALSAARERAEEHEAALIEERADLVNQRRVDEAAAESREAHIRHLESELAKVQSALTQAQHTIAGDADQLAESRTELRQTRDRLSETVAALTAKDEALTVEHQQLVSVRSQLQSTTAQAEQSAATVQHQLERIASVQSELTSLQMLTALTNAGHEARAKDLARTEAELAGAKAGLREASHVLAGLQKELSTKDTATAKLEGQLLARDEERTRLVEQLAVAAPLPARIATLTQQLADVSAERDRLLAAAHGAT